MYFRISLFAAALIALWCAPAANAAGSIAKCLAAGFSQACCKAEEAKGGFNGETPEASARRWNSLAMCKSGDSKSKK